MGLDTVLPAALSSALNSLIGQWRSDTRLYSLS
ncbi:MAG: hypothetical protein RI920_806, partial [Pseudomonadota bacterium]